MKHFIFLVVTILGFSAKSYAGEKTCETKESQFFAGINNQDDQSALDSRNRKIIDEDPYVQHYLKSTNSKIVAIQNSGAEYRCMCFTYLVKFDSPGEKPWIRVIKITLDKVNWL